MRGTRWYGHITRSTCLYKTILQDNVRGTRWYGHITRSTGLYKTILQDNVRGTRWYDHITRSTGLYKTILQDNMRGTRTVRRPGRKWNDNIEEWTGLKFQESRLQHMKGTGGSRLL